jgi:hypothetical protein
MQLGKMAFLLPGRMSPAKWTLFTVWGKYVNKFLTAGLVSVIQYFPQSLSVLRELVLWEMVWAMPTHEVLKEEGVLD